MVNVAEAVERLESLLAFYQTIEQLLPREEKATSPQPTIAALEVAVQALRGPLWVFVAGFQGCIEDVCVFVDEKAAEAAFEAYTGWDWGKAEKQARERKLALYEVIGWEYDPTNIYEVTLETQGRLPPRGG